jgi:simple sugar transport system ATP-binding protein
VLYRNARIIILDEPTTVLVPQEVDELFESLRGLVARGVTVIFISHKLDEVLKVADAITVIRAGRTVAEVLPADVTARDLAELMVGQRATQARHPGVDGDRTGRATGHRADGEGRGRPDARSTDVSFTIHRGEILGVAGVEGNGQTELLEAHRSASNPSTAARS